MSTTAEHVRLAQTSAGDADWQRWFTYVSDRAWGTVREDYSADGNPWEYFPHDHARSRAYRWNEDGTTPIDDGWLPPSGGRVAPLTPSASC